MIASGGGRAPLGPEGSGNLHNCASVPCGCFFRLRRGTRCAGPRGTGGIRISRGTRIVAQALLAIPDASPAGFRHWRRQAAVPLTPSGLPFPLETAKASRPWTRGCVQRFAIKYIISLGRGFAPPDCRAAWSRREAKKGQGMKSLAGVWGRRPQERKAS